MKKKFYIRILILRKIERKIGRAFIYINKIEWKKADKVLG